MNTKMLSSIFAALLLSQFLSFGTAPASADTWYPFPLASTLDISSPANMGKFALDAPAGKHGFLKVQSGNFVFEDGTPTQLWGAGLGINACFPTKAQADLLASRLAFMGFNSVRLLAMEAYFDPYGIFKDVNPTATDPQLKTTGTLSAAQLDKLDYLIWALKQKGIYVVINLMSARRFTTADGMSNAASFSPGARPVSIFDTTLVALQNKYAHDLMAHYNPYTLLQYSNDPTIAIVEVTNENSILEFWKLNALNGLQPGQTTALPSFYIQELDTQWNAWLQAKYGTVDAVKAAWSGGGSTETIISPTSAMGTWQLSFGGTAKATASTSGTITTINVSSVTADDWAIQFSKGPLTFKAANHYRLSFTAKATSTNTIRIAMKQSSPLLSLAANQSFTLTATPTAYSLDFTPSVDTTSGGFSLYVGKSVNTLTFQDLSITEVTAGTTMVGIPVSATSDIGSWALDFGGVTSATKTVGGTTAVVKVASVSADDWGVQFSRRPFTLSTANSYRIAYTASATTPTTIRMAMKQLSPSLQLALSQSANLTTTPTAFKMDFTPTANTTSGSFSFYIGKSVDNITFSDLSITAYPAGSLAPTDTNTTWTFTRPLYTDIGNLSATKRADLVQFYNDLQINYFGGIAKTIKTDLGGKVLISGMSGAINYEDIATEAAMGVVDFHAYWDHPRFPGTAWDPNNFTIKNTSMLADPNLGIIGNLTTQASYVPASQAITISEWNQPSPNIFAHENPLLLAAKAKLNSWDGILQFVFSQDTHPPEGLSAIVNNFFETLGNTQQQVLNAAGAYLMQKVPKASLQQSLTNGIFTVSSPLMQGATGALHLQQVTLPALTITSSNDAAITVVSLDGQPITTSQRLLLTVAGKTQNTGGGWINGVYSWGTSPVTLQNIAANINLTNSNNLQAFALNTSGLRMKSIPTSYASGVVSFSTNGANSPWIELNLQ